jgi:hypothetical protein
VSNFTRRKLMQWAAGSAVGSVFLGGLLGRRASAQSVPFVGLALAGVDATNPNGTGLWSLDQAGRIQTLGAAPTFDDASIIPCVRPSPYLAMAAMPAGSPAGEGVVGLTQDGQFRAFGFFDFKTLQLVLERTSSLPTRRLPYAAMAVMPGGTGAWALDMMGRLSTFGSAPNFGDGTITPCYRPSPYVALAPTPSGDGLYALTQNGQLRTFGNATLGDGAIVPCVEPVPFVALGITPSGGGLWALDLLGRVRTVGDAIPFVERTIIPCIRPSPYVALVSTPSGGGLYALTQSGQISTFGDALNFSAPVR